MHFVFVIDLYEKYDPVKSRQLKSDWLEHYPDLERLLSPTTEYGGYQPLPLGILNTLYFLCWIQAFQIKI